MADKLEAVIIAITFEGMQCLLNNIDLHKVRIVGFFVDGGDNMDVRIAGEKIPGFSYAHLQEVLQSLHDDNLYYMITGLCGHIREFGMMNRVVRLLGHVRKDRILNMSMLGDAKWPRAYRFAMNGGLNYFATGISYMEVGLSVNDLFHGHGVNLAISSQDIYHGLEIAKRVLPHNPDVQFVLIGIAPYSFSYVMNESFSARGICMHYECMWNKEGKRTLELSLIRESNMGIGYDDEKHRPDDWLSDKYLQVSHILTLDRELRDVIPSGNEQMIIKNQAWLKEYIELCCGYGAVPIGVVLPFSKLVYNAYPASGLAEYRKIMQELTLQYDFYVIDLWDMDTDLSWFYDLVHLNRKGAKVVTEHLQKEIKAILENR